MASTSVKHRDEFERIAGSGGCTWLLARKTLGTEAFGYNLVEIEPGGQLPEHVESIQVELYVILEGEAVIVLDEEETAAPAGTFASIEPATRRTILNRSEAPVTAMVVGVAPDGGYEPLSWA